MRVNLKKQASLDRAKGVSRCLKGISHEIRLAILYALRSGEKNVTTLTETLGCPQPTLSQHLGLMRDRGILKTRREGSQVYYRVEDSRIFQMLDLIKDLFCE